MKFFRSLCYLIFFYPRILFIYMRTEGAIAWPYLFLNWHHRTIYLYSKNHFIKCYLDKGRGINETRVYEYLKKNNFNQMPRLENFLNLDFCEILIFSFIEFDCSASEGESMGIDLSLRDLSINHGDIIKNVFKSKNNLYVLDFAFSTVNGAYLYDNIPNKYLKARAENFDGKILFFGTGSEVLNDIFDSRTANDSFFLSFSRNFNDRLILNLLAKISSRLFTKYIIKRYELKKYSIDNLVFFDFPQALNLDISYLKSIFSKVVLYYWNPVKNEYRIRSELKIFDEVWSYSLYDCNLYGLKFNNQFYHVKKNIYVGDSNIDILYVGRIKEDRQDYLLECIDLLEKSGLRLKIILVGTTKYEQLKKYTSKHLPYSEIIKYIKRTKSILDISSHKAGLSLRALEAIFYDKKIISNIDYFESSPDLSFKNNMVLTDKNYHNLQSFISTNYETTDIEYFNSNFSVDRFIKVFKSAQ